MNGKFSNFATFTFKEDVRKVENSAGSGERVNKNVRSFVRSFVALAVVGSLLAVVAAAAAAAVPFAVPSFRLFRLFAQGQHCFCYDTVTFLSLPATDKISLTKR